MHQNIKRFWKEGFISDDKNFERVQWNLSNIIKEEMRERGYVPVVDLGPYFSTSWNTEKQCYNFVLSLYGVYKGKEIACHYEYLTIYDQLLPFPTRKQEVF